MSSHQAKGGQSVSIESKVLRPAVLTFGFIRVGQVWMGSSTKGKRKSGLWEGCFNFSREFPMSMTVQSLPDRPDPTVIAAQNDAFRKLACLADINWPRPMAPACETASCR